jgi:transposase InsO family protein
MAYPDWPRSQPQVGAQVSRNHLAHASGDAINAARAAAGHNFRRLLTWLRFCCSESGLRSVTLDFSRPGKPTDNAFIEWLNGKFQAECLNALVHAPRRCAAKMRGLA